MRTFMRLVRDRPAGDDVAAVESEWRWGYIPGRPNLPKSRPARRPAVRENDDLKVVAGGPRAQAAP